MQVTLLYYSKQEFTISLIIKTATYNRRFFQAEMFCNKIPLTGSHQAPAITASLQRQWVCVEVLLEVVRKRMCSWFSVSSYNPWFSEQTRQKSPSTQRQQILWFANYIALRYIIAFPNFNISSCVVKSFSRNNKHELTQRQRRQHITPLVFNWHQRPCKRSLGGFCWWNLVSFRTQRTN